MIKTLVIEDRGYVWHVPLDLVARHRADHYREDGWDQEFEYAMSNPDECVDWFGNNMDWEDVMDMAYLAQTPDRISRPGPDATLSVIKHQRLRDT